MLGPRLGAILDLAPEVECAADIGSGHGALAVALARRGSRVIATERTALSFARLQLDLARAGNPVEVEARLGDGLGAIGPGEVDLIVVAGQGGRGILRILAAARWWPRWLLLQPMQDPQLVAAWLSERGWPLAQTRIAQRGRWYAAWLAACAGGTPS
jgi:tRNA (adenine22-N1)-methyltransferase